MQIHISGGKRKITLTVTERRKLAEVSDILSVLSDHNKDASTALEHVDRVRRRIFDDGVFSLDETKDDSKGGSE